VNFSFGEDVLAVARQPGFLVGSAVGHKNFVAFVKHIYNSLLRMSADEHPLVFCAELHDVSQQLLVSEVGAPYICTQHPALVALRSQGWQDVAATVLDLGQSCATMYSCGVEGAGIVEARDLRFCGSFLELRVRFDLQGILSLSDAEVQTIMREHLFLQHPSDKGLAPCVEATLQKLASQEVCQGTGTLLFKLLPPDVRQLIGCYLSDAPFNICLPPELEYSTKKHSFSYGGERRCEATRSWRRTVAEGAYVGMKNLLLTHLKSLPMMQERRLLVCGGLVNFPGLRHRLASDVTSEIPGAHICFDEYATYRGLAMVAASADLLELSTAATSG
jgi:hypothetical protein